MRGRFFRQFLIAFTGVLLGTNPGYWFMLRAQETPASVSKAPQAFPRPISKYELRLGNKCLCFDPNSKADLEELGRALKDSGVDDKDATGLVTAAERRFRRGLRLLGRLVDEVSVCLQTDQRKALVASLLETVEAINNGQRPPVPERMDVLQTPWFFRRQFHRPVAQGETPATNLEAGEQKDLSRLHPLPSTFWRLPPAIAGQDLYDGFGRTNWFPIENKLCDYSGPKESYGLNPGFEVVSDGVKIKLKFAEISSEPFATRIFDALGYNVDPTDYAPRVKVRYARALFIEFNLRKSLSTRFTFLGLLPLYKMEL